MKKNTFCIESIRLTNFATFKDQEISMGTGLNVIIGETGSGKSLILDALKMILGSKVSKSFIRKDCNHSIIEVSFQIENPFILDFLEDYGYLSNDSLFIFKKIIYQTGKSKSFINDQHSSTNFFSIFSKKFIDLVGQFENQKLLNHQYQLHLLDLFAKNSSLLNKYLNVYHKYQAKLQQLQKLKESFNQRDQEIDYIKYQIDQIKKLDPSEEKELQLIEDKKELNNIKSQQISVHQIDELINGQNKSIVDLVKLFKKHLEELNYNNQNPLEDRTSEILDYFENISFEISKFLADHEIDNKLDHIIEELDHYQQLKRKFNTDANGLSDLLSSFQEKINLFNNLETEISDLEQSIDELVKLIKSYADQLTKVRKKNSKTLEDLLMKLLAKLNMQACSVNFYFEPRESFANDGLDAVKILIQTNPGEGFHELKKIASGGELSRILLAIRHVISTNDDISIFLFDEVDSGIGGKTAGLIGDLLRDIAKHSQVIAITHLPQIASQAQHLVMVEKKFIKDNQQERTISSAELLKLKSSKDIYDIMVPRH